MAPTDIPALAIFIVAAVLAVFWLFFPLIISGKLSKLIKLQQDTLAELEAINRNTRPGSVVVTQPNKGVPSSQLFKI